MPVAETPAIELLEVSKRFGTVTALSAVSFAVAPGELFFLLGPSGCGKTTLLRILAGLETADAGRVLFSGQDTATWPPHRRGAPMVFQNYALWPHLNVRDNVAFGLVERRVPRADMERRVTEALGRVGLDGYARRLPGQLSGGQQQRVVLARALVLNPAVVLLDEPLSNLDAKLRLEMREEIEALHRTTDITFVYVTHDQAEALSLADRMAVMAAGRISAIGTPADLYHRPPNVFCAAFLGEANLIPGRVLAVANDEVTVATAYGSWRASLPAGQSCATGEVVDCLVRPEALQPGVGMTADRAFNTLEAQVQSVRLNGATVTVSLAASGSTAPLKATLLARGTPALPPTGTTLQWVAPVAATIALRRPEPGSTL